MVCSLYGQVVSSNLAFGTAYALQAQFLTVDMERMHRLVPTDAEGKPTFEELKKDIAETTKTPQRRTVQERALRISWILALSSTVVAFVLLALFAQSNVYLMGGSHS